MIAFALVLILFFQGAPAVRPGSVTGQLRTIDGAPAIAVRVAAVPVPTGNAVRADGPQYFVPPPPESTTLTDKQGRYRLANIPAGRYYIMAGVAGEPTYYPAATDTEHATAITIASGSTEMPR